MKKIAKRIIIAVLVLSMVLGVFAGCQKPTDNKSLAEKYGITMSDKTITYDGEKHELGISVDSTILQGKSYEVTYDVNGTVVTKVEFTDAGEYTVTAKVKVAGDETVYPLTKKLTIKKADLSLEVGNLFLRQLQGVATLGNPRDLFKNADFVGKDTSAILGTLSFEVFNGASKVSDLSTLKPTDKVSSSYTVKVTGMKELANYEVKLTDGKLYVLTGAEFDVAKLLKEEIATVPTTTTINTLDYYSMRAFAQNADHIVSTYPSTNEIQRLMCGTIDVNTVKALKKTADTRVENVYDFDDEMETSVGKINYLGASHDKNEYRTSDTRLSELRSSAAARKRGEYGDVLAFEVIIYNTEKYNFTHVLINGVEFTTGMEPKAYNYGGGTLPTGWASPKVYTFGSIRHGNGEGQTTFPTDSYSYKAGEDGNPGANDGVKISNEMLGALSGKTSIIIEVVAGEVHDAGIYKGSSEVKHNDSTTYPELGDFTITSKGDEHFRWSSASATKADLVVGREYKFTISTNPGYGVVSVEIGNKIVLANAMDNGSFTVKLTEDHLTEISKNSTVKIVPTFEKVYSFDVKASVARENFKTLSNSNKDGIYSLDAGTIKLIGVSQTTVPTLPQEKTLSLSIVPEAGWLLFDVVIEQDGDTSSAPKISVNVTEEFAGSSTVTIDLEDSAFKNFKSNKIITIKASFRESYPIAVKSNFNDKTTNMTKKSDGSFVGDYGSVEVLNLNKDTLTTLAKDGRYYIRLIGKTGYVPKSVKINGITVVSTTMGVTLNEGVRYPMIKNDNNIIINSNLNISSSYKAVAEDSTTSFGGDKTGGANTSNYALTVETRLDAGEDFVIEVEYEAYYFVSVSNELPSDAEYQVEYGMLLTKNPTGKEYTVASAPTTDVKGELFNSTSPLIKVGDAKAYYCYYSDTRSITARILASDHTESTNETNKYIEPIITIGCDGNSYGTSASARSFKTAVSEAISVHNNLDSLVAKKVSSKPILPGGEIEIRLIVDGYDAK